MPYTELHYSQRIGWLRAAVLAILGSLAARAGGARPAVGALRVTFWGALAMALTYGVGTLFGTGV